MNTESFRGHPTCSFHLFGIACPPSKHFLKKTRTKHVLTHKGAYQPPETRGFRQRPRPLREWPSPPAPPPLPIPFFSHTDWETGPGFADPWGPYVGFASEFSSTVKGCRSPSGVETGRREGEQGMHQSPSTWHGWPSARHAGTPCPTPARQKYDPGGYSFRWARVGARLGAFVRYIRGRSLAEIATTATLQAMAASRQKQGA